MYHKMGSGKDPYTELLKILIVILIAVPAAFVVRDALHDDKPEENIQDIVKEESQIEL
ncbi:hypothetical protein [Metabacillus arenae]|uniref:Uncharacterized protein n=1 Tax=Metabacillus arenae TaxID=2771434 RepID=A0A926NDD5_9BACI|nr:hypothetical protein [Metabacillus arenae]MBD1379166.1 hypothetical protein [Metabacillus arenae]